MLEVIVTSAVVSRGYDGAPALKFSEKGDAVRFRIGKKVYDSRAENNTRWINLTVKAFGEVCKRLTKMQLKEGSFINFRGRLDEDIWTDQQGESKSAMIVVLDDIEYAGGKPKENQDANQQPNGAAPNNGTAAAPQPAGGQMPDGFTGYEAFGGGSFFDEN